MGALLAAAHSFYTREDERVRVAFAEISVGRLDCLPFVNRVLQLKRASDALLHNTMVALDQRRDTQKIELVICSQPFGVGKTTFVVRLAHGLNVAFNGKLSFAPGLILRSSLGFNLSLATLRVLLCELISPKCKAGIFDI